MTGRADTARARRAELGLLLVCLVWGGTFVMVQDAVALVGPMAFLAVRFALAALVLAPFALAGARSRGHRATRDGAGATRGRLARPALAAVAPYVVVGAFLFAGYALQTIGLRFTTSSRAGFLTGLQVVLVPLAVWAWERRRPTARAWLAAGMAAGGLALLMLPGATGAALPRQALGDALVLGCAAAYALQIVAVGRYAGGVAPLRLALGQIVVAGVLAAAGALCCEPATWPLPPAVWAAAAFTGVLATALAFGIQADAQRHVTPERAGLVFATEPIFAALFGTALAGDALRAAGWAGAALVVAAMATGGGDAGAAGAAAEARGA